MYVDAAGTTDLPGHGAELLIGFGDEHSVESGAVLLHLAVGSWIRNGGESRGVDEGDNEDMRWKWKQGESMWSWEGPFGSREVCVCCDGGDKVRG